MVLLSLLSVFYRTNNFIKCKFVECSSADCNPIRCILLTNQECKVRLEIVNVNSDEILFYPFSIKASKCSGSYNNINDQYAKTRVPDITKNFNVKVLNLMSGTNEKRQIKWHEMCKCKCILDASVCNYKQRWNNDKCRCECEELIDKGVCNKGSIWNPSNCECECDKSCDVGEYLDYENCKCRKKSVDKLVAECTENVDEVKIAEITLARHEDVCVCPYTICVIFSVIPSAISIGIGAYFAYSRWHLRDVTHTQFGTRTQWNCIQQSSNNNLINL